MVELEGDSGEKISGRRARKVVKSDALRAAFGDEVSEAGLMAAVAAAGLIPSLARGEGVAGEWLEAIFKCLRSGWRRRRTCAICTVSNVLPLAPRVEDMMIAIEIGMKL